MKHFPIIFIVLILMSTLSHYTVAAVTTYTNKAAWQSAAGDYTTIHFNEFPDGSIIGDLYAPLGIHFTDGFDQIWYHPNGFPIDGWGLNGALDSSTLEFDIPINSIAIDFPGNARIKLYSQGQLIYTSPIFGGGGLGFFGGLLSTEPFDEAVLEDPFGGFFADNLYFGPPIPAPSALALLTISLLGVTHRRRRA